MVKVTKNYDDDGNDDGGGQSDDDEEDDYDVTRSLGALRAPTSSWRPFGPLYFVLRTHRALRPVRRARLRSDANR